MALSLLLFPLNARAGSYTGPAYSGGTVTLTGTSWHPPLPKSSYSGSYGGGGGENLNPGQSGGLTCSGPITTTFTWSGPDPAPAQGSVIVDEQETVQYSAASQNALGSGSAKLDSQMTQVSDTPGRGSDTKQGAYWHVSGGSSISLTSSPSASGSLTASGYGYVGASVSYSAAVSPVTINLAGATLDSSGNYNILVGQNCTSSLVGIPKSCTVSNYKWTVSGATFQSWTVSSDHSHTTEIDGSGPLNQATASWYWNELNDEDRIVSCTATVTPPVGQGSPFSVTVSELVSVYVPDWTANGTGGYVKVNLPPDTEDYTTYEIYAGATIPMENVGQLNGMNIKASVTSPVPALFGNGTLELVQIVTPRESWVLQNGTETTPIFAPQYGEQGLDGAYPYGWISASISPGIPTYTTGDTPGFALKDVIMISANLKHDFEDYLMYLAPGSQQPVPVAHFVWNDNGTANIPTTFYWRDYAAQHNGSDAAGTVTPSGTDATFLPYNEFPSWTQID